MNNNFISIIAIIFLIIITSLFSFFVARRDLPPYTWVNKARLHIISKENSSKKAFNWAEVNSEYVTFRGLAGFAEDGDYSRLPDRVSYKLRYNLRVLERNTSGGIASIRTNSDKLKIVAQINSNKSFHMTDIMSAGLDIYLDGKYFKSLTSIYGALNEVIKLPNNEEKVIDVYFPLFGKVRDIKFYVDNNAVNKFPNEFGKSIVFYGSSITQGCCASNPAMSYAAIVSRKLGVEQINLGFSDEGLGDIEIADYITELSPSIIILDYWANPSPELYKATLTPFIQRIRSRHHNVPIIVTSTFANPGREDTQKRKDKISYNAVKLASDNGDKNIYFLDDLLNENEGGGLIDSRHLNSYGFAIVGQRLVDFISLNDFLN